MKLLKSGILLRNLYNVCSISRVSTDVQILVSPKVSLVDELVNTIVTGLKPGQKGIILFHGYGHTQWA